MKYIMTFHHQLFPKPPQLQAWRCGCGRVVFRTSADNIEVMNDIGVPWEVYPPSQHLIQIMCHSCKNKYTIRFQ